MNDDAASTGELGTVAVVVRRSRLSLPSFLSDLSEMLGALSRVLVDPTVLQTAEAFGRAVNDALDREPSLGPVPERKGIAT